MIHQVYKAHQWHIWDSDVDILTLEIMSVTILSFSYPDLSHILKLRVWLVPTYPSFPYTFTTVQL